MTTPGLGDSQGTATTDTARPPHRHAHRDTTRKVGLNDATHRSGPGMFKLFYFLLTYICIAMYDNATDNRLGEEGFR